MITIALDGFAARAGQPLPPLVQQHLWAFAAQEDYALLTLCSQGHEADYLLVRGCEGCVRDACVVGCRAALLRRALAIALPDVVPRVLRHPLRRRAYRHALFAWPMRGASPLDRRLLDEAGDLAVHIAVHQEGEGVRTVALIGLGAVEAAQRAGVLQSLRDSGWRVAFLPRPILPAFTRLLFAPPRIRGTRADWTPHLFTHTGAAFTPLADSAPADADGAAMGDASCKVFYHRDREV
jgi:hypothetical protein